MHTEKMKAEDIVKKITEHAKVRMCLHTERESGEMPIEHTNVCVCVCVYMCVFHVLSSGVRMTYCIYVSSA